jgi:Spy/CpxP family protein refolding chaperone
MTELTMQQARIYSEIVQLWTPAQQQQLSQFAKERETSLRQRASVCILKLHF